MKNIQEFNNFPTSAYSIKRNINDKIKIQQFEKD